MANRAFGFYPVVSVAREFQEVDIDFHRLKCSRGPQVGTGLIHGQDNEHNLAFDPTS
jgi:hypothetical protein